MNGTGPTYENVTALDAGVALINAANIFDALPTVAEATPSTYAGGFRYNSQLLLLQSRPTTGGTNACSVLLAKIQNNTGAAGYSMTIAYDFAVQTAAAGRLPGYYVYYSLSGAPGSWVRIAALSGSEVAGRHTADVDLSANPLPPGAGIFVLWVDDNADGVADPSYTIDNLAFGSPLSPIAITQQPVGTNVIAFRPFSLSVQATGTAPGYQWYKDNVEILDATAATYSVAQAQMARHRRLLCDRVESAEPSPERHRPRRSDQR